jgi:hypothetical protein
MMTFIVNGKSHQIPTDVNDAITVIMRENEQLRAERKAWPNLQPVIEWLENGCDPKEAAKELRSYDEAIRTRSDGG